MRKTWKKAIEGKYRVSGRPARPYPVNRPFNDTPEILREFATKLERFNEEMVRFNENLDIYNRQCEKNEEQFRIDLEDEFGTKDHPKRHVLFNLAYIRGKYAGFEEIVNQYEDLFELVK